MHRKEEGGKNLETADWQLYADSIFPLIETYADGGALLWNWDCQFAGWSMKGLAEEIGVTCMPIFILIITDCRQLNKDPGN